MYFVQEMSVKLQTKSKVRFLNYGFHSLRFYIYVSLSDLHISDLITILSLPGERWDRLHFGVQYLDPLQIFDLPWSAEWSH